MKIGDLDREMDRERRLDALGDAIAETIGTPATGATGPLPEEISRVMMRPRRKLRVVWKLAPVLAVGVCAVLLFTARAQPLGYELSGTYAARDDGFETPGDGTATAKFSDGTSIAVAAHSAAHVRARTRAGATIRLDHGRASFAVVHRPGARWNVEVGPFEIAVTGTEFDVHWADDHESFEVVMKAGTVVVRGSLTGEGIPLHAGQRLVASLSNKTLVVSEVARAGHAERGEHGEDDERREPPAALHVVAPQDPPAARPRHERTVAQAAPELTLQDVPQRPGPSAETLARMRALSPPPFEPAPAAPPAAPAPAPAPAVGPGSGSFLGMGGTSCNDRPLPQIRFEHASEGFRVLAGGHASVFQNPFIDHTYSWCGDGSLRFDASFDVADQSVQSGEAVVFLPHNVDLRGKTVTVRFLVRAPFEAEFTARILAGQGDKRTGNSYNPHLTAGSWWAISTTFHDAPPGFGTFESDVASVDRIILKVDASGSFRVWSGPIYIDDIGWR